MKTSIVLSLAAAAITSAQNFNITTSPFYLFVASEDGGVNTTLSACHVGAALESLCLSDGDYGSDPTPLHAAEFQFNTSAYAQTPTPPALEVGILHWWLHSSCGTAGSCQFPSSAAFNYDATTNLALPIISPGDDRATLLSFDAQNDLTLQQYGPGTEYAYTGSLQTFYRWYACKTYYGSYNYMSLAWGLGASQPDNPSCVAVNVTRVFV
ncbi:heatshock Hsp [Pyrenophora seminiperda CCB06]|uniref:Heatshock Hsp n=1 Tax=Pyrenophora seminiperda CCB06 TaxID=1302712 RepID=A0A3M7MH12_9PLEO|nr:heatshock Hsp [Pyrenophora seminiperda CCB06]